MIKKERDKNRDQSFRSISGILVTAMIAVMALLTGCSKSSPTDNGEKPVVGEDANLLSISVKTAPAKIGYFIGETFASGGLVVEAKYDNGKSSPVNNNQLSFSGFDSGKPIVQQNVTISYEGKTTSLIVEIYPFEANNGTELTKYVLDEANVVIPAGILKIGNDAFIGKSMKSITFAETLQEIGEYAFFSCKNLESITLPASLKSMGEGVFDNCQSLVSADLSKTVVADVSDYLFNRCPKLSNVKLPSTATRIGSLTFNTASALKTVTLPSGIRFIGLDAFRGSGLEQISLPNNVQVIRQRAFLDCASLTEVTVFGTFTPNPEGLTPVLESSAFQNVPALTRFEIPQGITSIEQVVLSGAMQLKRITIPATVQVIKFRAFELTGIQQVRVEATVPPTANASSSTSWSAFPASAVIEVPAASLDTYKQAYGWQSFAANMKGV